MSGSNLLEDAVARDALRRLAGGVSGQAVPDEPPAPPGEFHPFTDWVDSSGGLLSYPAFVSARKGGALVAEKRGPRGGYWWAVVSEEAWREWVATYKGRVARRAAGSLGSAKKKR